MVLATHARGRVRPVHAIVRVDPRFARLVLNLEVGDIVTQLVNHIDKFDVIVHDAEVVLLMDLAFLIDTLLEGVDGVLEELFLVVVLGLDIGVNFDVSHLTILHILLVEAAVHGSLEQVEIIDVLNDPVNGRLELLNIDFILSD